MTEHTHGLLAALTERIHEWRERAAARRELDTMNPHEVDRMLSEVGLTRGEVDLLARSGDNLLLYPMLAELGLDEEEIRFNEPLVMRDLQRLCAGCPTRRRCRKELGCHSAGAHLDQFCPNAQTLEALVAERKAA